MDYQKFGHVRVITMNRPERLNAMGRDLLSGMAQSFMEFEADPDARVAILIGTGRAFCVGIDIKENAQDAASGTGELPDISPLVNRFFPFRTDDFDKPVIAAVNGLAMGGGFFLAANADLIVASENAVFEISEIHRGWTAGWWFGHTLNLPRQIGMELAMGTPIPARRAYDVGLVNEVVPMDELLDAAMRRAEHVAGLPPLAVRHARNLFTSAAPRIEPATWQRWQDVDAIMMESEDAKESQLSFLEKRDPVYRGR